MFIKRLFLKLFRKIIRHFINSFGDIILDEIKKFQKTQSMVIMPLLQSCGNNVFINENVKISEPRKVIIGNNVHIGENSYLATKGGLSIGDNTHISRNFTVYTSNHNYWGNSLPYDNELLLKPVSIGKNVWIGMNVMVIPGVNIGDGAIIGMGTVVSKDVPPLSIIGSQPFRVIKFRDSVHYHELEDHHMYGGIGGKPIL